MIDQQNVLNPQDWFGRDENVNETSEKSFVTAWTLCCSPESVSSTRTHGTSPKHVACEVCLFGGRYDYTGTWSDSRQGSGLRTYKTGGSFKLSLWGTQAILHHLTSLSSFSSLQVVPRAGG
jgi:hypothetical protein